MTLYYRAIISFALIAYLTINSCDGAKINTPRVLLPWFSDKQVNFTFEIFEGGCYSWSLSRDDIIEIEPIYDSWGHCSRAARVYVSKSCSPPGTVIILAEEVNTGEILRGDVDIDKISTLKVVSTTWTLFLEEAPEAFEVVAYDDQGNRFSTLEGISFEWTIQNIGANAKEEPLVHLVRWTDTDYEAPRGVAELEAQGLHSYTALLYGQAMGETKVSVCLTDICTDFNLHVIASVVLTPAVAFIAQGDTLRYRVVRARAGRLTIENLIDTTYSLRLPSQSTIELEDSVSLIRGLNLGSTTVSLMSGSMVVATANVTVTEPHSIKVNIRPFSLVVTGEYFIVQCTVYDKDGKALIAGDEMLIRLSIDGVASVDLLRSTENGTLTDALAHSPGTFTVTARLFSVAGLQLSKKIESQASAEAVSPLEVVPEELFVAWTDVKQEIKLKHRGGGAEPVVWGESETDRAHHRALSLSPTAVLTVTGVGDIGVKVQLQNYPYVVAFGRVWSAVPEYLQMYSPGEARVGKPHYLHIALTGTHPATNELYNFHNCDCSTIALSHLEGPEPYDVSAATHITPLEGACCVLQVYWRVRGVSTVRGSVGRVGDSARITIRATPQLLWPNNAAALVDGTRTVIALGEALTPQSSDPKVVDVSPRDGGLPYRYPDAKVFTLKCRKKGDARIELVSLTSEDRESVQFEVACATHVTKIRLEPSEPTVNCTGGPRIWLRPDKDTYIRVILQDAVGRELLDERGTKASWEMSPKHNGIEFKSPNTLLIENHPDFVPVPVAYGFYQTVMAEQKAVGWSGTLKVSLPDATATIQARVAAPLKCEPCKVNLAWEGEDTYKITTITGGSGRYIVEGHLGLAPTAEDGTLLAQLPAPGTYELIVSDACVPNEKVAVQINIEEILSIEVQTARAVCVDACVPVTALIRGVSHAYLTSSRPAEYRGSGHVVVKGDRACGVREGAGRLRASIRDIWSADVEILVFPPLVIVPRTIKLPPTAKLQLRHSGGPPAHLATLHYATVDTQQAVEVSTSGLVQGLTVGSARVRLVATDSSNFEMASAEATVEVIPVTGLKVRAATQTLLVGHPSPVWLESSGLTPLALSGIQPAPRVTWTLRDAQAASLYTTHIDDNLERSTAEGLSVRVVPRKGGVVTIDVRVRNMGQLTDTRVWESTIEILAITDLKISVEGLPKEFTPGDRLALAIGSTVRLQSSPRSAWIGQGPEGVLEISANGELTALQAGFSAVLVQSKDERNNVYRETLLHVEVSLPHYCTIQPSFDDDSSALRVVLRNSLGRELLAPAANVTVAPPVAVLRRTAHSALGKELLLTTLDPPGAFVHADVTASGVSVSDEVWISSADLHAHRLVAAGSWLICLPGAGWRAPPGVTLLEGTSVTLALLVKDASGKHVLRADRPSRMLTVHQVPLDKMELLAAESGQLLSVLSMTAEGVAGSPLVCSEENRLTLEGLAIELPFSCHTQQPHTANAKVDFVNGQVGCVIIPAAPITAQSEVELCAEWGLHRTCTKVHLIPPIIVTPLKVSLLDPNTEFTIKGHIKALRGVTMTSSPDLKIERKFKNDELTVSVTNEDLTCGSGWIILLSPLTDQEFRVEVERECEVACRTLLGALFALLRPYLSTLVTMVGVACASYYVLSKQQQQQSKPASLIQASSATIATPLQRPSDSRSFNRSTWSRSPYASTGPVNPVYGDASVLPDASFSPNTTRVNSRFL